MIIVQIWIVLEHVGEIIPMIVEVFVKVMQQKIIVAIVYVVIQDFIYIVVLLKSFVIMMV